MPLDTAGFIDLTFIDDELHKSITELRKLRRKLEDNLGKTGEISEIAAAIAEDIAKAGKRLARVYTTCQALVGD